MISKATEERIKEAANIVDVVGRDVSLKRSGSGYVGLCPFHGERTPSFHVTPAKGIYKCFGCGKAGDPVNFVMAFHRMQYPEALRYLADIYRIQVDEAGTQKQDFSRAPNPTQLPPPKVDPTFFPKALFRESLKGYKGNYFAQFLANRFGSEVAADLIGRFFIGTSKEFAGANVFWQIDENGRVRSGKIMVYDPATGKRDRGKLPNGKEKTNWAHTAAKLKDFILGQCFFGIHQLKERPGVRVGILESEKSAILASLYLPDYVWLAAGGKDGLKFEKFAPLKGREIMLYPDAGLPDKDGKTPFEKWSNIADQLSKSGFTVRVSYLLEKSATTEEKEKGYDLADYLLRFDPEQFQAPPPAPIIQEEPAPDVYLETRIDQFSGLEVVRELTEPGGYPAMFDSVYSVHDTPLPTAKTDRQVKTDLLCAAAFVAEHPIPFAPDEDQQRAKDSQRAKERADWNDYKAGKIPYPYKPWINTGPLVTIRATCR